MLHEIKMGIGTRSASEKEKNSHKVQVKIKKLNLGAEAKGPLNCQFTLSVSSGDDAAPKAKKKTSSLPLCQRHESLQKALSAERDCFSAFGTGNYLV